MRHARQLALLGLTTAIPMPRNLRQLPVLSIAPRTVACQKPDDATLIQEALQKVAVDNELRLHALKLLFSDPARVGSLTLQCSVLFFLVAVGPALGLKLLGFKATGIAAGSIAASIQSTFPLITAGSWFAWAQSLGAMAGSWGSGVLCWKTGLGAASCLTAGSFRDRKLLEEVLKHGLMDEKMRELLHRKSSRL